MSFTQRTKGEQSSGLFPGEPLEGPLITATTFVPNILLLFNESETRQKILDRKKKKKPSSVRRGCNKGKKKKKKDLFRFSNVKAADPHFGFRADAAAAGFLADVGGLRKKKWSFSLNKDVSFPFRSICQGWKRPQPPSRLLEKPTPSGQCRRRVLSCDWSLTPRLHYGWEDADVQSPGVTPQDPTRSVSINGLWKPCYAVCVLHITALMRSRLQQRSCTFAPAPNVEMGR